MPWVTNYDDFDEVLVDRIVAGDRAGCPISAAEAAEAVRILAGRGYNDGQIAYRLGFTRRSVIRIRRRRGIAAALPRGSNRTHCLVNAPHRERCAG